MGRPLPLPRNRLESRGVIIGAVRAPLSVLLAIATLVGAYASDPRVQTAQEVADGLADEIRTRYPVTVDVRMVTDTGSFVVYAMIADYPRLDASDFEAYERGVVKFTLDRNEAAVLLMRRTVEELPAARLVGVYEDSFDVRAWPRDMILSLDEPGAYREPAAYRRLTDLAFRYNFNMTVLPLPS